MKTIIKSALKGKNLFAPEGANSFLSELILIENGGKNDNVRVAHNENKNKNLKIGFNTEYNVLGV